jgi:glycosyltransferase involved in cell wall biosynthesis
MTQRPHICFVAPAAWPVLARDTKIESVGGAEVQQVLLAREFVNRGFRVSMICGDYGQPDLVAIDSIDVFKYVIGASNVPVVRFFHPRLTNIWRTLRRIDPDIVYQRTAAAATGVAALYSKWRGRRFVYAAACDLDVTRHKLHKLFNRRGGARSRRLFELGLRLADAIVCQHAAQAQECRRSFGRDALVIPSCYATPVTTTSPRNGDVLWAGTLAEGKRPELFLELARRLPGLRFRIVGGPSSEPGGAELFDRIRAVAAGIPNLEFIGFVPYARIDREFDRARVFVNTSDFEGFPNTFLQSWARRIPTVSFCDVGGTFEHAPLATVVEDIAGMATAVERLMTDDRLWEMEGGRLQRYAHGAHSPAIAIAAYEQLFATLMHRADGRAAACLANESLQERSRA